MQALFERSEENDGVDCLRVLGGDVKRFDDHWLDDKTNALASTAYGWNTSPIGFGASAMARDEDNTHFYFV